MLLILWTLLEAILSFAFRPLFHLLSRLPFVAAIARAMGQLPPYVALAIFAIPFVIIEPIKAFALYWFGVGHVVQGSILYVLAHLASILIVERIYHAVHAPLMRIGWFARLMSWLTALRDVVLDWARATPVWQSASRLARSIRRAFSRHVARS